MADVEIDLKGGHAPAPKVIPQDNLIVIDQDIALFRLVESDRSSSLASLSQRKLLSSQLQRTLRSLERTRKRRHLLPLCLEQRQVRNHY